MDFGEVEHTLSEKKGPMPVWAYGVLIGVVMIYLMHRRGTAATSTAAPADASTVAASDATTDGSGVYSTDQTAGVLSSYLAGDPTNTAQNVGIGSSGLPGPVTNQQWARVVADYLNGLGDNPSLVANALSKYLSGTLLSPAETSVIDQALTYGGTPPEGVIPVNGTQANPDPTPVPPSTNPPGVTGVTGGFTGGVGDHVSTGTKWGSPTTTHAGTGWGT